VVTGGVDAAGSGFDVVAQVIGYSGQKDTHGYEATERRAAFHCPGGVVPAVGASAPEADKEWERKMSATDKANNKMEDLGGKAKEGIGKLTGDRDKENEGKGDQAKSSLKDAGEKVKDAFKH
jgi:uncharacterized protein YjbJ (UPF0337 family)